jgi:GldM C-terminal domain
MKYIFILISLIFSSVSHGQVNIINQSLTDSSLNFLYIGVDNRIRVTGLTDNYRIAISGGGGSIIKTEKNQYVVHVNSVTDLCELTLLKGTKSIFRKPYKVRTISTPITTVGGLKDTAIRVSLILTNPFISIVAPGCYFRLNYRVTSFEATFIQDADSTGTTTINNDNIFSPEQIKIIKTLKPGDNIYFDNIRAIVPGNRGYKIPSFWIKIE